MKVAFFDFCKTIVKVNSLSEFVKYVLNKEPNKYKFFKKILFNNRKYLKPLILPRKVEIFLLRGNTKNDLVSLSRNFFYEILLPNFNYEVINYLKDLKSNGYTIVIVSAALEIYLKFITEILPVDIIISTRLKFRKNLCTGFIDGIDTFGLGKLKALKERLDFFNSINWEESYFFSDDFVSDKHLLEKVGYPFIVIYDDLMVKPVLNDKKIEIIRIKL